MNNKREGAKYSDAIYHNRSSIMYKREPRKRIFVNRTVRLEKIEFFGFDMDYTLAAYKSPNMEIKAFDITVERLISIGYPEDFRSFKYNPIFPVRGLWLDLVYGNLLKVDVYGNILLALHGFHFMTPNEIEQFYPNKFIHLTEKRIYVLNTLFHLPETFLVACIVDYLKKSDDYKLTSDRTGLRYGHMLMSYRSIFKDIRNAFDWVHCNGAMKELVLANLEEYVEKEERLEVLMTQLKASGRKTFLLTNSEYFYTNGVMNYLLGPKWTTYFDIIIVDANKPSWFAEGTVFRQVDVKTGSLKIGIHTGPFNEGAIYSGGSCNAFCELVKARGRDVLYIGDHIFGDVLRSKKVRGWRTFLVIPELNHELGVWTGRRDLYDELQRLDARMADLYRNLDANTKDKPEIASIIGSIKNVTGEMEQEYGVLGSLFRSGPRTTFFAGQVERYADLYATSCYNLVHYPTFYFFRSPMSLMPHESTVLHTDTVPSDQVELIMRQDSVGHQVRGWNKKMAKTVSTAVYFEEDDEVNGETIPSSRNSSGHSSKIEKYDLDPLAEEDIPQISNDNNRNIDNSRNSDVVVSLPGFVEN